MPDPVKTRPGVPSPEGNPIARQVYGSGAATLPQRPISTVVGNQRLIPIATWSEIRLRINISQAGILSIVFANTDGIEVGPRVASVGTLTLTANAANTETVVVNGKVYTFQTTLTDSDGNVLIGASASDSIDNLIAAINLGPGAGTLYAVSMSPNTDVSAVANEGDTMDVTALYGGTGGDAITTTETLAAGGSQWGGATLSSGVDGEISADGTAIVANTEVVVNITASEHVGEPWLLLTVGSLGAVADVTAFDVSGSSF